MKKTKSMRLAVLAAGLLCCSIFTVPAYAQSSEPQEETPPAQEAPAETEAQPETQNPFSTDGTGTVVDNATDEEGKEFYTITTPDENIFYLVIDKQKTTDNVYFLNAVTEADLLPLAEKSEYDINGILYPHACAIAWNLGELPLAADEGNGVYRYVGMSVRAVRNK